MKSRIKKSLGILLALVLAFTFAIGCAKKEEPVKEEPASDVEELEEVSTGPVDINIGALKGPTAMGMVKMMDDNDNGLLIDNNYKFTIASAVDEIPPAIAQGTLDIAAVPANLASVLYNNTKGEVQVLAINTLGVLYIVENGDTVKSVGDLKGKTIYASGKGATPEYALDHILRLNEINPATDLTIEWLPEHAACVAALAENPEGIAMLPQPFVTTAQLQNENLRVALDLTKEWESFGDGSSLITGVVVVRKAFAEKNPEAVADFLENYQASVDFVTNESNLDTAAELIGKYDIVPAPVAKKALPFCNIVYIDGSEMKEKLSGYLTVLNGTDPASVGGTLPADDFYYSK